MLMSLFRPGWDKGLVGRSICRRGVQQIPWRPLELYEELSHGTVAPTISRKKLMVLTVDLMIPTFPAPSQVT